MEKQVQVLEEEKEKGKMWQRMVQVDERLPEDVLCLSVGVSQTGAALRTVEHKLWDWDAVVARVSAFDELVKRVHEPLQKQSVRVMTWSTGVKSSRKTSMCVLTASRTWNSGPKSSLRA